MGKIKEQAMPMQTKNKASPMQIGKLVIKWQESLVSITIPLRNWLDSMQD